MKVIKRGHNNKATAKRWERKHRLNGTKFQSAPIVATGETI